MVFKKGGTSKKARWSSNSPSPLYGSFAPNKERLFKVLYLLSGSPSLAESNAIAIEELAPNAGEFFQSWLSQWALRLTVRKVLQQSGSELGSISRDEHPNVHLSSMIGSLSLEQKHLLLEKPALSYLVQHLDSFERASFILPEYLGLSLLETSQWIACERSLVTAGYSRAFHLAEEIFLKQIDRLSIEVSSLPTEEDMEQTEDASISAGCI